MRILVSKYNDMGKFSCDNCNGEINKREIFLQITESCQGGNCCRVLCKYCLNWIYEEIKSRREREE